MLNCSVILEYGARRFPEREALVVGEVRMDYRTVLEMTRRLASGMQAKGIRPGDRVLLACPNIPQFSIVYYAALMAGAVVVPVNVLSKTRELAFYLEDTGAKAFFCFEGNDALPLGVAGHDAFAEVAECEHFVVITADPAGASPFSEADTLGMWIQYEPQEESVATEATDTAVILFTSGTTGKPKGAELSHGNIFSTAQTCVSMLHCLDHDRMLVALPLFHVFAQTVQMNCGFLSGATLVLMPRFELDAAVALMVKEKISLLCGVPTIYWALLNAQVPDEDLAVIRECFRLGVSGGAPIPVEVLTGVQEKYSIRVLEGYGLSETASIATFNTLDREPVIGSVGVACQGVELRVVDEAMQDVAPGETGEVVLRGHSVMKGYFNHAEETEKAFRGGWFHTGDLGSMDADGVLRIVDRLKDMIIRGGYNVYPKEVEAVLDSHPAVSLSAVIGVPCEKSGQEVKAVVILNESQSLSADELREWSKSQMADYKYPRIIEFVDAFPLNATGKVLKTELRRMHEGG